jgi:hypothetical protein
MLVVNRMAIALALLFALPVAIAHAGKPAIFKPDIPPSWTAQQRELANKALDVLFDACPAIDSYLTDISDASLHVDDMSRPLDANVSPEFFRGSHWRRVLLLVVSIVPKPTNKTLAQDAGEAGLDIDFYMGAGDRPGIYIETNQKEICGSSEAKAVLVRGVAPNGEGNDYDMYVPAPKLKILNDL